MKTLKEILQLEVYEPKSPDEKRFKDKHVVVKHEDANGNKDDLFNAKNIKTVNREPRHGYNPGEDEKVYEEVEELDERQMNVYAIAMARIKEKYNLKGKNVDLTKAQTVEAHELAKKIAKRMGVPLKESKTQRDMIRLLNLPPVVNLSPPDSTKTTSPEEAGPDGRYGGPPQNPSKGVFKVGGKIVIGTLNPDYERPPKSPRSKSRSKK